MERLIDLCYNLCQNDYEYYNPELFVFRSIGDFTQIDALNHSHTVMFKIRVLNRDLGVWFKHPCVLYFNDAKLRKLKLERLPITDYHERTILKHDFDDVFEIEYDSANLNEIRRLGNAGLNSIGIQNNSELNVYSIDLLNSAVICDDKLINLKITGKDMPLKLNYKQGIFDVYCLIAPRITFDFDYYLKVGDIR